MNYEYKFTDKKIILTEEEHKMVLADTKQKKNLIMLRGGDLIVNMSLISTVTKTNVMTAEQEAEQRERERNMFFLRGKSETKISGTRMGGMAKAMGPRDLLCLGCQEIHYIPTGQLCLPCSRARAKVSV